MIENDSKYAQIYAPKQNRLKNCSKHAQKCAEEPTVCSKTLKILFGTRTKGKKICTFSQLRFGCCYLISMKIKSYYFLKTKAISKRPHIVQVKIPALLILCSNKKSSLQKAKILHQLIVDKK